jgi:hypothetical protein
VSSSRSNGAPIYKRPLVPEGTEGAEPCVSGDVIGMSGNGRYVGKSVLVHVVQLAEPPEWREPLSGLEGLYGCVIYVLHAASPGGCSQPASWAAVAA